MLYRAIIQGDESSAKRILRQSVIKRGDYEHLNAESHNAMYLAVTCNMVEVVKMLREKGDNLLQTYDRGVTLLHLAA